MDAFEFKMLPKNLEISGNVSADETAIFFFLFTTNLIADFVNIFWKFKDVSLPLYFDSAPESKILTTRNYRSLFDQESNLIKIMEETDSDMQIFLLKESGSCCWLCMENWELGYEIGWTGNKYRSPNLFV